MHMVKIHYDKQGQTEATHPQQWMLGFSRVVSTRRLQIPPMQTTYIFDSSISDRPIEVHPQPGPHGVKKVHTLTYDSTKDLWGAKSYNLKDMGNPSYNETKRVLEVLNDIALYYVYCGPAHFHFVAVKGIFLHDENDRFVEWSPCDASPWSGLRGVSVVTSRFIIIENRDYTLELRKFMGIHERAAVNEHDVFFTDEERSDQGNN